MSIQSMCACAASERETSVSETTPSLNQNIDNLLAVQTFARALDLLARNESHVLEDFEHVIFVVLHLGNDA